MQARRITFALPLAGQNFQPTRLAISIPSRLPKPRRHCRKVSSIHVRCTPKSGRSGPGTCPICGMALEPAIATADKGPNPELIDMTRRFWIGLALALPVFLLEMGGHLFDLHLTMTGKS